MKVTPTPRSILVAEDDPDDRLLVTRAFKKVAPLLHLAAVNDGVELLDYLGETIPDLILLDLRLPRKNGIEAAAEIKANPDLRHIPIVVLSTSENSGDIRACYAAGVNSFITKPSDFPTLMTITSAIASYWFTIAQLPSAD